MSWFDYDPNKPDTVSLDVIDLVSGETLKGTFPLTATVEIELSDENAEIRFPQELKIIREVTDDAAYKNAALAAR